MHLYKAEEWESGGRWYVNDLTELGSDASKWWTPAKILDLDRESYISMLAHDFNAKRISYGAETDCLVFSFDTQAEARKFKNYLNRAARFSHYMCGREYS